MMILSQEERQRRADRMRALNASMTPEQKRKRVKKWRATWAEKQDLAMEKAYGIFRLELVTTGHKVMFPLYKTVTSYFVNLTRNAIRRRVKL